MDLASAEHGIGTMETEPQRPTGDARNPGDVGDADLVAQARGGDREAFGTLVDRYADQARRVARAVLQDPDDADDAAQDAFLAALVKLDQYDSARRFGPWLMRIVANAATDRRRRRKVRSAVSLDESLVAGGARPDVVAEREVLLGRLRAALAELPERRRIAVELFDVEGYSHAEIAQVLGIPEGTVRSEVFHARRKLRALLADWRDDG
jgi:RNA polymerase sigma-70 factor, ECF subfamily